MAEDPRFHTVHWWCRQCEAFAIPGDDSHKLHRGKFVGLRGDILVDHIKRLIRELDITDRLVYPEKKS